MTSRLRSLVLWVALPLLTLGAVVSLWVLPAMRADARGRILAQVQALQDAGAPLSRAELVTHAAGDDRAAETLAALLETDAFDPWIWEPPADVAVAPEDFAELVENRIFADELTEEERAAVAGWLEDLGPDLERLRSLRGKSLGDLTRADVSPFDLPRLSDLCRVLSAKAVLAAYDGETLEAVEALTDAFALARVNDDYPLAITFLSGVYCSSLPLAAARRAAELLPEDADLSALVPELDSAAVDARLRTAFQGERVHYLEAMGLVRDGAPTPEDEFVFRRRSPWQPLSWPPHAEWGVLDDLLVLETLISGGTETEVFPLPDRTTGVMRNIVNMDVVGSAGTHAAEMDELRARLER